MIETVQMGAFKCCISTVRGRGGESDAVLFVAVEVSDSMTHCGKVTGRVLKKGRVKKKNQTGAVFKPGQFSNLGSCHTGAVVTLGQLSTWAVVLPGQLSNLGSCLTWAVVYLGSCCLGSCLPGQLLSGQLS